MVSVYNDVGFSKEPLVKFVKSFNDRKAFLLDLSVSLFCGLRLLELYAIGCNEESSKVPSLCCVPGFKSAAPKP